MSSMIGVFFLNGLQLQHVFQAIINGWLMVLSSLKNMSSIYEMEKIFETTNPYMFG